MKAVVGELVAARCISGRRIMRKPLSRLNWVLLSSVVLRSFNIYIILYVCVINGNT